MFRLQKIYSVGKDDPNNLRVLLLTEIHYQEFNFDWIGDALSFRLS